MSRPVLTDTLPRKVRRLEREEHKVLVISDVNIGPQAIVTDNIADGAITADLISSVNADSIDGVITAEMIGTINADQIEGEIQADQIGSINASDIVGTITSGQIGSVSASTITGTITSGQIGSVAATTITGTITSGQIGSVSASTISGGIVASQITSVTASTITGGIAASQITSVNASAISGSITAAQIGSVNATAISGSIAAAQIGSVNASAITGSIVAAQIASVNASAISAVNASAITGTITSTQIGSVNAGTITVGTLGGGANLLSNSSFEDAANPLVGWSVYNNNLSPAPTLDTLSTTGKHGARVARITNGTDTAGDMGIVAQLTTAPIVEAGKKYTLSAYGKPNTSGGNFRVHINWYDITDTLISGGGNSSTVQTGVTDVWTRAFVTATAPANAYKARPYMWVNNPSSGFVFYFDAVMFEESDIPTAYNPRSDEILSNAVSSSMIGSVNATAIQGSILAAQIGSVNASAITGSITATQIGSVNASAITGSIGASQIGSVNASAITGSIGAAQIGSVNASAITGTITAAQIDTVDAADITGTITSGQIGSVSAGTITGSITSGQIGSVAAGTITVGQLGGGGNLLFQTAPTAADVTAGQKWSGSSLTIAVETGQTLNGFNTWKGTTTSTSAPSFWSNYNTNHSIPANPGEEFTFSAYIRTGVASRTPRASIIFYDASDVSVGSFNSSTPTIALNTWEKRVVTGTAPANTAKVRALVWPNAGNAVTAGEVYYIGQLQLEKASINGTYGPRPDEVLAGSITAGKITVANLGAISADLGTINAGVITGATMRTAASPAARVEFTSAGIKAYTDATNITFAVDGATGKITTLAGIGGPNLLPNSGFENSSTNFDGHYGVTGGTLDTTISKYGTNSAKVTIGATGSTYITVSSAPKGTSPTEPGKEHVASVWAYTTLSGKGVSVSPRYFDSANNFLENGTGNTVTLVPNEWTRVISGIGVAPANTTQVGIRVEVGVTGGKTTGDVYFLDAMQVEEGRIATAYGPKPDEIRPNQVTGVEIAPGSVEGAGGDGHIVPGTISGASGGDIVANSIAAVSMAANSIATSSLVSGAITANKLDILTKTSTLGSSFKWDGSTNSIFSFSTGTTANMVITDVADSQMGGKVARISGGSTRFAFNEIIPYDPQELYRFTVRVRRQTAATDNTKEKLYVGFDGYAADGTSWVSVNGSNSLSGQHYAISNYDMNAHAVGTWVELSGYYKGYGAVNGSTGSQTPSTPSVAHPNVRYFRPMAICNYLGGDGVVEVDSITVDKITVEPGQITTQELKADAVDATIISANAITSKHTITGATLQTATSGKRVVINSNGLKAYASDGTTALLNYDIPSGTLSITGTINVGSTIPISTLSGEIGGGNLLYQTAPTVADVNSVARWSTSNPTGSMAAANVETTNKFANYNTWKHTADGVSLAVIFNDYTSDNVVPATPGETFTASGYFFTNVAARYARLRIIFYDAANVAVAGGSFSSPVQALTAGVWTRLKDTRVAPATTAKVRVLFDFASTNTMGTPPTAGDVWYIGGPQLERGDIATAYAPRVDEYPAGSIADTQITTGITGSKISGALSNATIGGGSVTGPGTMDATIITDGTITTNKIGANQITAGKLNVTQGGGNLMADSSFEDILSVGYWTSSTGVASIAQATPPTPPGAIHGTKALQFTNSSTAIALSRIRTQDANSPKLRPGVNYTFSAYMRSTVTGRRARIACQFRTSANASVGSQVTGTYVSLPDDGSWVRLPPLTTNNATSTVDHALIYVEFSVTAGGNFPAIETYQMDAVQVEEGDLMTAYSVRTEELLPGTISGAMIQADAIDGKTITGATIRTGLGVPRIEMNSTALQGIGTLTPPVIITPIGIETGAAASGLPAATYYYKVVAYDSLGSGVASAEASRVVSANTQSPIIQWKPVIGAASYRVYRGTASGVQNIYWTGAGPDGLFNLVGGIYTFTNRANTEDEDVAGTPPAGNLTSTPKFDLQSSGALSIREGTIVGSIIKTAETGARIELTQDELVKYADDGITKALKISEQDGLDITTGIPPTPYNDRRIRWLSGFTSQVTAEVYGQTDSTGSGVDYLFLNSFAQGVGRGAQTVLQAYYGPEAAKVVLQAGQANGNQAQITVDGSNGPGQLAIADLGSMVAQFDLEGHTPMTLSGQNGGTSEILLYPAEFGDVPRKLYDRLGLSDFQFSDNSNLKTVSTIPASGGLPDGAECYYVADSTNGVVWHLKLRTSGTGWEFVGGPPLTASVATNTNMGNNTYKDLDSGTPSITIPTSGDYIIEHGCLMSTATGTADIGFQTVKLGAAAASDTESIQLGTTTETATEAASVSRKFRANNLATGAVIKAQYKTVNSVTSAQNRWITVTPVTLDG